MTRRGRIARAALGLLLFAAPLGTGPLRAQTEEPFTPPPECSTPPPPPFEDGIATTVVSPTGTDARTSSTIAVEARFSNESRRPVVNTFNGQIVRMEGFVLACEAGLVAPETPDPVRPDGGPRAATYAWSAEFPTNGRFVIVLEADGTSTNPDDTQFARVVVPVTLAVPPKKPSNVDVSEPVNGVVTIAWEYAEPEFDLFGFEIRRARQGSADYVTIKDGAVGPRARSVQDAPPVGAWRYHVIAYRRGAPEGAVSRDDTVAVAEQAPAPAATGGGTATSGPSGGAGSGTVAGGSTTTPSGGSASSAGAPRSSVDLSDFAASLNARRTAPPTRIEPPDPGFQETLPFDVPGQLEVEDAEEPEELGADEPNVGLGQRPVSDPGERQRSFGFVAFGLLLFVLSMAGLFLKSEVKRADLVDLDVDVDDAAMVDVDAPSEAVVVAPVVAAAAATRRRRRTATAGVTNDPPPNDVVAEAPVTTTDGNARRRRAARTRVAAAPVAADANGSAGPAIDIPETRSRWSGRIESVNGHAADAVHDFDDLAAPAGTTALATTSRRRPHRTEAPLDAPGLDVPDPVPAGRRRTRAPQAPLPSRNR